MTFKHTVRTKFPSFSGRMSMHSLGVLLYTLYMKLFILIYTSTFIGNQIVIVSCLFDISLLKQQDLLFYIKP